MVHNEMRDGTCRVEDGLDALSLVCKTEALARRKIAKGCLLAVQVFQKPLALFIATLRTTSKGSGTALDVDDLITLYGKAVNTAKTGANHPLSGNTRM